jgi:hypothetical protein
MKSEVITRPKMSGKGNVFQQEQQEMTGTHFKFNLRSQTGIFYQVKGKANRASCLKARK